MSGASQPPQVLHFPPRDAGRVLDAALAAAMAAGEAEVEKRKAEILTSWGAYHPMASEWVCGAAAEAAAPILQNLTADPNMISIVAFGMAEEVMLRLRNRGVA
jgi:hypothetical protein